MGRGWKWSELNAAQKESWRERKRIASIIVNHEEEANGGICDSHYGRKCIQMYSRSKTKQCWPRSTWELFVWASLFQKEKNVLTSFQNFMWHDWVAAQKNAERIVKSAANELNASLASMITLLYEMKQSDMVTDTRTGSLEGVCSFWKLTGAHWLQ